MARPVTSLPTASAQLPSGSAAASAGAFSNNTTRKRDASPEDLRKLLRYDPNTGKLFWKRRERCTCASTNAMNSWNAKYAGKEAFTGRGGASGWHQGAVWGKSYLAHRVAWAIHYGEWPAKQIDHINGDPTDNRIENLRDVDHATNMKNRCVHKSSKSGVIGVYWCKASKAWRAEIRVNGVKHHLGRFAQKEDAAAARKSAEKEFGFHPNHGRATNTVATHGAVSEEAVPLSSHVDASSRSYSLEEARRVVRQPNRSDAEIQAACFVLKTQGNWQDDWIVCQIELAMQPNPLEV